MEPRPPKTTKPAALTPRPVSMTPPPVPNTERMPERAPERPSWSEHPAPGAPPAYEGGGAAEQGQPDPFGSPSARSTWYDPGNPNALIAPPDQSPRSPLSPVVSPRGERRGRFLGPLLAALLLVIVIGGGAYAFDRARDGDDDPGSNAEATRAALGAATNATPEGETDTPAPSPTTEEADAAPAASETPAPTEEGGSASAATATDRPPTREATSEPSTTLRAADYLPTLGDLPEGFQQTREGRLRKADVAVQLGTEAAGEELLDEWTWRENASLEFSNADAAADETFFLSVGVHRFGRSNGASDGLNGLADVLDSITNPDYEEVDVAKIGDEARAFASETADANLYVLYVRNGNIVYRVGGSSITGDPSVDVIALAEILIDR